jgi:hypothetical protein
MPIAYETHPKGEMILFQDVANPAHHFFDANMPGQPYLAGKSFKRLMAKVPTDGYVEEAGSLSLESLNTALKQATKSGYKGELPGTKLSLNNAAYQTKLPGSIDNGKGPLLFDSYFKARAGAKEVTNMYKQYGFPKAKATLYRTNMDTQFGINVPNIRLSRDISETIQPSLLSNIGSTSNFKSILQDYNNGLKMGIKDLQSGRKFSEVFPITKSQKAQVVNAQNEAFKEGTDFVKD